MVLAYLLAAGNYLNSGTLAAHRKNARGVKLNFLAELTKTTARGHPTFKKGNSFSFLHCVQVQLFANAPDADRWAESLPTLEQVPPALFRAPPATPPQGIDCSHGKRMPVARAPENIHVELVHSQYPSTHHKRAPDQLPTWVNTGVRRGPLLRRHDAGAYRRGRRGARQGAHGLS